ncbi:MAG: apolipoprotein N-acyltransferase [Desulfobacteraceae bacterium 4572_87]|nr:MAG: apolipoprotein N-acyltransferase [Desulfobacteraceae bacterium 4572_87]
MNKSIRKNLFLALTSGLLLGIPWIIPSFFFLIFIAWVPLLQLEKEFHNNRNPYALLNYAFAAFFLMNVLGAWWVMRAQWLGAILIFLANSLVQSLVFWSAGRVRTLLKIPLILPFLFIWLGYEYFHNIWDLAWPWFNLGNALVTVPKWIQWVEFTGVRGVSLWIILTNFAVFKGYEIYKEYDIYKKRGLVSMMPVGAGILFLLLMPSFLSYQLYRNFREGKETVKIALIQPNLDPYTEKFVPEEQARHLEEFFRTAETLCDPETRYLLGPETLIVQQIDEANPLASPYYQQLQAFRKKRPELNCLLGVHSYRKLGSDVPPGSRFNREENFHYEAFNTALFLAPGASPQFYHKTKLVPIFERMPFVQYFGFLGKFNLELGGYNGTYSNRKEKTDFQSPDGSIRILPILCFESVFGPYCSENLTDKKGFICMITNDGWWKNTTGYRHHFNFSPIRAIECRRDLVRVANTGISAIIDARGMVMAQTPWWKKATLKGEVHLCGGRTFFARNGDWLGRISLVVGIFLIVYAIIRNAYKSKLKICGLPL